MMTDPLDVLKTLEQLPGLHAFEAALVHHIRFYRNTRNGGTQEVDLEILDRGPGESLRYHCTARADDGKAATGNSHAQLEVALALVHWGNLDEGPVA